MIAWLIRVGIFLGTAALGLLIASLILDGFTLHLSGFFVAIIVYALIQLGVVWLLRQNGSLAVFAGIISTFIALLLATLISDGLSIDGILAWIVGTLIVWAVTALGVWLAAKLLSKPRSAH